MRSQEDIHLIKALQSSIESLQVDFDAVVKKYDEARAEVERLKTINQEVLKANYTMGTTRPEPSRLEIAATLVASRFSSTLYVTEVKGTWIKYALEGADALIAAAKEGK